MQVIAGAWQVSLVSGHSEYATDDHSQGRPLYVKHGARCTMDKVGGRQKPKGGNLICRYKFVVIG